MMERVGPEDHPLSTSSGNDNNNGVTYYQRRDRRRREGGTTSSYSDPGVVGVSFGQRGARRGQQQQQQQHRHEASFSSNTIRSPTVSLIQSAARSILDDATPSTIFSDDEEEDEVARGGEYYGVGSENNCTASAPGRRRSSSSRFPSPTLSSLQVKTAPALPSEQDRRRFIGCMAAILASAYDFDEPDELATAADASEIANSSASYRTFVEQLYEDDLNNVSYNYEDDENDNNNDLIRTSLSMSGSNCSLKAGSFESENSKYSAEASSIPNNNNVYLSQQHMSGSTTTTKSNNTNRQNLQQQRSIRSMNSKERIRWSRQRHRRRRYDIMCKFLVSSAELLLLDKSVAKGFLPMLEQLLVPQQTTSTKNIVGGTTLASTYDAATRSTATTFASPMKAKADCEEENVNQDNANAITIVTTAKDDDDSGSTSFEPAKEYRPEDVDKENLLRPFLESLSPGAGFRCLSLLLLQHLLTSQDGYDARIRHVLKKVGVIVLINDMERDPVEDELLPPPKQETNNNGYDGGDGNNDPKNGNGTGTIRSYQDMANHATRKWESLEHSIARRLIRLSESSTNAAAAESVIKKKNHPDNRSDCRNSGKSGVMGKGNNGSDINEKGGGGNGITYDQIVRGVKIGSAGLVAGALFAVTGGLAAPGIAAGVAAFAGAAAGTAALTTLTSTAVVTTIFGVGGGSLAAYKMQRRTQGLTEFEFRKETDASSGNIGMGENNDNSGDGGTINRGGIEAELFSCICISGWLRDECDFQRPWGLHPTSPPLDGDRVELLERFYSIHSTDHLPKCRKILDSWKGEEDRLWSILREKYGTDPDHLFPLKNGQRAKGALTLEQEELLDRIFIELGYNSEAPNRPKLTQRQTTPFERMKKGWEGMKLRNGRNEMTRPVPSRTGPINFDSIHGPRPAFPQSAAGWSQGNVSYVDADIPKEEKKDNDSDKVYKAPQHLATVWDYKSTYGGELYTIRWESELLQKICDCVMDMAMDVVSGATRQILKQTIFSTLLSAIVWPSYLLSVADMIDGDWTIAVERAEQGGKELAKTLLFSRAGHRPVTLIGFSFGARVIYCCLKELARLQDRWEDFQDLLRDETDGKPVDAKRLLRLKKEFEGMREPASVVEDAILMGLPNHLSLLSWKGCRQVVSGRLVNCYSTKDLILSLMFQAKRFSGGSLNNGVSGFFLKPVCGTCPVPEPGVENIDVSDLVSGHQDYCLATGKILERVHHGQPLRYSAAPPEDKTSQDVNPQYARKLVY